MTSHKIGTREQWAAAREQLLAREKEHTRLGDELARQRRELPWVRSDKEYRFDTDVGPRTLAELFDGRSQLLIYHFMFGPSYAAGCPTCSSIADSVNGVLPHLNARDVTMLFVSQAPLETLQAFKQRMGWSFPWVSSFGNDFNHDYGVLFTPEEQDEVLYNYGTLAAGNPDREGTSVFVKDESGQVFHTYSAYARGIDLVNTAYNYLDLVPKGRDEDGRGPFWVRRHDEY